MPYVMQRRTIAAHCQDVLIAPFVFILVNLAGSAVLLLVIAAAIFLVWLLGGDLGGLGWDWNDAIVWGGVVVVLWFAASILALRDCGRGDFVPHLTGSNTAGYASVAEHEARRLLASGLVYAGGPKNEGWVELDHEFWSVLPNAGDYDLIVSELNPNEPQAIHPIELRLNGKPRKVDTSERALMLVEVRWKKGLTSGLLTAIRFRVMFDGRRHYIEEQHFEYSD